jgi:hypothetical protein
LTWAQVLHGVFIMFHFPSVLPPQHLCIYFEFDSPCSVHVYLGQLPLSNHCSGPAQSQHIIYHRALSLARAHHSAAGFQLLHHSFRPLTRHFPGLRSALECCRGICVCHLRSHE